MKVVALVQARAGSKRLPGKVLADVGGIPLLAHSLRRARAAQRIDEVVLATTELVRDAPVAAVAATEGVAVHRGSEDDVLRRMLDAARAAEADAVVRLTADCPLLDPGVIDHVVAALVDEQPRVDYASNVLDRTYPKGLDCEALWTSTLARIDELAVSPEAREHVTWFAYCGRPDLFELRSVTGAPDGSGLDWSVDTADDLERVRRMVGLLQAPDEPIAWHDLLLRASVDRA